MGKTLKNIVKNEGLFILLSIVNIYIIPFVLYKVYCDEEIWYHAEYDFCIFLFGMFGLWLCGIGGVIQIIITALFEAKKKIFNDTALWLTYILVLPALAAAIADLILNEFNYSALAGISLFYIVPVIAVTGIWLGRLISGKLKGVMQFYTADKIFIVGCIALSVAFCIYVLVNKPQLVYEDIFCRVLIPLCLLSVLYSFFSDLEYMTDRLLRAMSIGFLAFMPCGIFFYITNYIRKYTAVGNNSPYSVSIFNTAEFSAFAAVLAATAAVIGTITGYYFRIMKIGGGEIIKKIPFSVRIKRIFVTVITISAFLCALNFYIKNKWYLHIKNTNVWDELGIDENDIYMLRVGSEFYSNEDDFIITTDREAIHKTAEIFKGERGIRNVSDACAEDCEPFYIYGYDSNYTKIFMVTMDRYRRGTYCLSYDLDDIMLKNSTDKYDETYSYKNAKILIPSQYYGKESTKRELYRSIAKEGEVSSTEKVEIMDHFLGQTDYIDLRDKFFRNDCLLSESDMEQMPASRDFTLQLCVRFSNDEDPTVRSAAANRLGKIDFSSENGHNKSYWMLRRLVDDEDANVRAEAYTSLGNYKDMDALSRLYGAMNSEQNEKARFFAILAWGNTVKILDKQLDLYSAYVHNMLELENKTDIDKLAYNCVLVRLGEEEYRAEAERLIKNISDGKIKQAAEEFLAR